MNNINIGYVVEKYWYIEALINGEPRDYKHKMSNWHILTNNYGWKGIKEVI